MLLSFVVHGFMAWLVVVHGFYSLVGYGSLWNADFRGFGGFSRIFSCFN
ncbi:MAG: hypothetical protein FWG87_14870 [Defluviitaleaceae bacterium]|nr:hypothetical protein [Defluviitaleaceae bacterium]